MPKSKHVVAKENLFDQEIIKDSKGNSESGYNYSKKLGGTKVLKQISLVLEMFKNLDKAFVGADIEDSSYLFVGKNNKSLKSPNVLGIHISYMFKNINTELLISMYKEAGLEKIFNKALQDAVDGGFISAKDKDNILKDPESIMNVKSNAVVAGDAEITKITYKKVILAPVFLLFFSNYAYRFYKLRNKTVASEKPEIHVNKTSLDVSYPFTFSNGTKFTVKSTMQFIPIKEVYSLEGKKFEGWGYDTLPIIKAEQEKEDKLKKKLEEKEALHLDTTKQKEKEELEKLKNGPIKPIHKKMFLFFNDIQENLGDAFFKLAKDKFPEKYELAKQFENSVLKREGTTDAPEKDLDEVAKKLNTIQREKRDKRKSKVK